MAMAVGVGNLYVLTEFASLEKEVRQQDAWTAGYEEGMARASKLRIAFSAGGEGGGG